MSTITTHRIRPSREGLLAWAVLLNTELLLVVAYLAWTGVVPTRPVYYVYPFVWINAALWALWAVDRPSGTTRRKVLAGLVGAGYFLVLAYFGGLFAVGVGGYESGLNVVLSSFPPGWSPAVLYGGSTFTLVFLPFKVFGYLTLAYLAYATVLDAASGAAASLLGLFSCVSCTLPLIAGVLSGFVGGSAALVSAAYGQSYGLSTLVFVVTVVLLVWRPTMADVGRLRRGVGR
ncbi:DUF7546 family protein [Halomarina litorea]|uniref:DUF7546 family protein n=1 Tax=Halomarina litorea TaxID=2961595 RepID=UPI0020C2416F|nr:hypothetical protein [Halomarina sp. BCD28]